MVDVDDELSKVVDDEWLHRSSQDVVDLMYDIGVEVSLVDLDVVDVMVDQELLVVVERCLEGIEEVTSPNAVG